MHSFRHAANPPTSTLMVGRQRLYVDGRMLQRILPTVSGSEAERICGDARGSAEEFFKMLGADAVESLDESDFEGAQYLHDFTTLIPDNWKGNFDLVVDVGTLEHIFDPVAAIQNYRKLLEIGGTLLMVVPTNNQSGHGF